MPLNYNVSAYPETLDTPQPSSLGNPGWVLSAIQAIERTLGTEGDFHFVQTGPVTPPSGGSTVDTQARAAIAAIIAILEG